MSVPAYYNRRISGTWAGDMVGANDPGSPGGFAYLMGDRGVSLRRYLTPGGKILGHYVCQRPQAFTATIAAALGLTIALKYMEPMVNQVDGERHSPGHRRPG
jgi:hypothetical protein